MIHELAQHCSYTYTINTYTKTLCGIHSRRCGIAQLMVLFTWKEAVTAADDKYSHNLTSTHAHTHVHTNTQHIWEYKKKLFMNIKVMFKSRKGKVWINSLFALNFWHAHKYVMGRKERNICRVGLCNLGGRVPKHAWFLVCIKIRQTRGCLTGGWMLQSSEVYNYVRPYRILVLLMSNVYLGDVQQMNFWLNDKCRDRERNV